MRAGDTGEQRQRRGHRSQTRRERLLLGNGRGFRRADTAAIADQHFAHETHQRGQQGPLKLLQRHFRASRAEILAREMRQPLIVNLLEPFAVRAEWLIHAARLFRDLLERRVVEVRLHELAVFIARKVGAAVLARHGHEFASRAADADRENFHAVLRRLLRGGDAFAAEVFAVGNEHKDFRSRRCAS